MFDWITGGLDYRLAKLTQNINHPGQRRGPDLIHVSSSQAPGTGWVHCVSWNWPPFGQTLIWLNILQPFKDVPLVLSRCPWELGLFLSAWSQKVLSALWGRLGDDWPLAGTQSLDVAGAPSKDHGSSPRFSSDSQARCCLPPFSHYQADCVLISWTGTLSPGPIPNCNGYFGERLRGMRVFIWKVPLNKKWRYPQEYIICLVCL